MIILLRKANQCVGQAEQKTCGLAPTSGEVVESLGSESYGWGLNAGPTSQQKGAQTLGLWFSCPGYGTGIIPVSADSYEEYLRTEAEDKSLIFWLSDVKNWLVGKDPGAGKEWRQEEKGSTEDEMVEWHHRLNGHEFEQTPRETEGLESLVYCSPHGCQESDTT